SVPDGLIISLREIGFFESGSATIQARSQAAFGRIAALLAQRPYRIRIEGHTDNVPIHNAQFASNWELSTARSTELVRLLITQYGFAPGKLSAAGYAQYHPLASNLTAEGRAQNRRVDVVILGRQPAAAVSRSPQAPLQTTKPDPRIFRSSPRPANQ
ncbi:MAG TPA: OmpA family protein, partial [Terriglobales bacterium]